MGAAKEKFQNKTMIIIVDGDGLIGSLNPTDSHHSLSQTILVKLSERGAKLIYPVTAIAESVTFFQGRLNKPELANQIIQLVKENLLNIESVGVKTLQNASSFFDFKGNKHNTLFDCIVAAIADEYKADAIFSFDGFYKKKGFKLAAELK